MTTIRENNPFRGLQKGDQHRALIALPKPHGRGIQEKLTKKNATQIKLNDDLKPIMEQELALVNKQEVVYHLQRDELGCMSATQADTNTKESTNTRARPLSASTYGRISET